MPREILLIDDDIDEFEMLTEALYSIDKSIKCIHAWNLTEALEFLKTSSPDCIFIDFNMPKTNGLECLAELKKSGRINSSRVILYSNHIDEEMSQRALALGAHYCLQKPAMINVLLKRLKDILKIDQAF
jgi:DNA-binding response OmpR family regulator